MAVNVNTGEETNTSKVGFGNQFGTHDNDNAEKETAVPKARGGYDLGKERPHISTATDEGDRYWGAPISVHVLPKNQLRTNISMTLQELFKDYIGCNLFLDPNNNGLFRLIAFFGPENSNPEAVCTCFDKILEKENKSETKLKIYETIKNGNKQQKIYQITRKGHGILSDLIAAPKDENGWIKNIEQCYMQITNTPIQYNGLPVSYYNQQNTNYVWAAVELDITSVMRLCMNRIDGDDKKNRHQYDYLLRATNIMIVPQMIYSYSQQEVDYIIQLEEIDSTEMANLQRMAGMAYRPANPYMANAY
jgi:hypothetical protein